MPPDTTPPPAEPPAAQPMVQEDALPGNEAELDPKPDWHPRYCGSGRLAGRTAIITGADSGIGRAIAVLFAREGADVAIVYLQEDDDAAETRRLVESEGRRALTLRSDIGSPAACAAVVRQVVDYSATKGAITAFTRSLALNLVKDGIRVNAVAPGPIWTPLNPFGGAPPEKLPEFGKDTPMGRPGQPDEVAPSFLFLACADSSYMTGQVLHPNGGQIVNG